MIPGIHFYCLFLLFIFVEHVWLDNLQKDAIFARKYTLINSETSFELPTQELAALYDLYESNNGQYWNWYNVSFGVPWNFTANCNPCEEDWQGVVCSLSPVGAHLHVTKLYLVEQNLTGTLPLSLMNLTYLEAFVVFGNVIQGSIPAVFSSMSSLHRIDLGNNFFTGSVDGVFDGLYNLTTLIVENNLLNGTLPSAWGNLSSLQILVPALNAFSGQLPTSLGNLSLLLELYVDNNQLSGTIPASFGQLHHLQAVQVNDNFLTGSLPSALCSLTARLQYIMAYNNPGMRGSLPSCLGNLTALQGLGMYYSGVTGTIPTSLGQLVHLQLLWLGQNSELIGSIPAELGNLTELMQLNLNYASLTGSISASLGQLTALTQCMIADNHLSGSLPPTLGNWTEVTFLVLYGNSLTGCIPESLGNLERMQLLFLDHNLLTGSIPPSLLSRASGLLELQLQNNRLSGRLSAVFTATTQRALYYIDLSDNQLTGTLPAEAFQLPELNTFVAVSNCFSGTLPETICSSPALVSLILDGLQTAPACQQRLLPHTSSHSYSTVGSFNGHIPPCLFNMPNLISLHLSGNGLTGTLSADLVVSNSLVDLTLSHNALTGSIPRAIQRRKWTKLDLSYNRLSGVLDSDFAAQRIDFSLTLGGKTYNLTDAVFPATYSLQNNRLSHTVPSTLVDSYNVSLLGSNMFECNLQKSDLPQHDDQRRNYQCGSDSFDRPFYLWLAVCFGLAGCIAASVWCISTVRRSVVVIHALECLQKWNLPKEDLPRNFRYVSTMGDILCQISVWCTALIVLVLVPWYTVASLYYGTYTHQYAWAVSAAFLSGSEATAVQLVVYVLVLVLMVGALVLLLVRYDREEHHVHSHLDTCSKDGRYELTLDEPRTLAQRLLVYWAFATVNIAVVGGVNVAFVLISLSESNRTLVFAQIALSLFKLGWNTAATPYLIRSLSKYISHTAQTTGFVTVQVVMALFNNIAMPCLIVGVISPSCFYTVFHPPSTVTSYFIYQNCEEISDTGQCLLYEPEVSQTSYAPPFRYDYQCSSSFVTYYAPAFVYLGIAAAFVVPALKVAAQQLQKRCRVNGTLYRLLNRTILPRIMRPLVIALPSGQVVDTDSGATSGSDNDDGRSKPYSSSTSSRSAVVYETLQRDLFHPVFDANIFVISLVTYLGVLLTFGVVFPPLAVVMCVTMLSVAWQAKLTAGRFLCVTRELRLYKFEEIIEQECVGAATVMKLRQAMALIVVCSCCFYALFLFDTLGDVQSWSRAYWVLIVMPMLSLCLVLGYVAHRQLRGQLFRDRGGTEEGAAVRKQDNHTTGNAEGPGTVELMETAQYRDNGTVVGAPDVTVNALHA